VTTVTLLDVNVLVALFDADHVHHDLAHDWFADEGSRAWATCPTTQNGFLRVLSNPAYQGSELRPVTLLALLRQFCASRGHHAWSDTVSLQDAKLFDLAFVRGHRQLTDVYLLGLAKHMQGRLATFDRTIPLKSVLGARPDLLQVIEP
jgi:uncharacterized protein